MSAKAAWRLWPASKSTASAIGRLIPVSGYHGAGPVRRGFGMRRVTTFRASASSSGGSRSGPVDRDLKCYAYLSHPAVCQSGQGG